MGIAPMNRGFAMCMDPRVELAQTFKFLNLPTIWFGWTLYSGVTSSLSFLQK